MDSIVIWNLTNNSPVLEIKQRYEPSLKMSLVLLPDESLASALPSQDFNIRIWNTTTGLLIREITTKERVLALAVIQNGNLASSQTDETIKIYDLIQFLIQNHNIRDLPKKMSEDLLKSEIAKDLYKRSYY